LTGNYESYFGPDRSQISRFVALSRAADFGRDSAHRAVARDRRVALTIATLITLWMEPGRSVVYSFWLYWLLTVYLVHAVVVMLLVRFRIRSTRAFRLVVHGADILWPVLISLFTNSERGPFFLFFVFVMAAAAYRWGLWETVGTAVAAVVLLWLEDGW